MGAAASHPPPPPLVEVSAPGGKVLVPSGSAFTVHPPYYQGRQGPVYLPSRHLREARRHAADIELSEDSGSSCQDRRRYRGGGETRGRDILEMGMNRSRSAREMPMGTYPYRLGMPMGRHMGQRMDPSMSMGNVPMGGMGGGIHPVDVGMEYGGGGLGDMGAGAFADMPTGVRPPEYTPYPGLPRYRDDLDGYLRGAYPDPKRYPSSPMNEPLLTARRLTKEHRDDFEGVPTGAFTRADWKGRRKMRERVSDQSNLGRSPGGRVGSSGKEWIPGADFLDVCTCTTNCTCRKSQRVLYRKKNHNEGSDSESDRTTYHSGEIRYILKDDLGRDCGDHSGCKKKGSDSSSESDKKRKKKAKKKREREQKVQFEGFKEDLLEALGEKLQEMKQTERQQPIQFQRPFSEQTPYTMADYGASPSPANGARLDPRLTEPQGMGMSNHLRHMGMNDVPAGLSAAWKQPRPRTHGMPRGRLRGTGMAVEDDMSISDADGLGDPSMGDPYLTPDFMQTRSMRPEGYAPWRSRGRGRFGSKEMGIDMHPSYRTKMRAQRQDSGKGKAPAISSDFDSDDIGVVESAQRGSNWRGGHDCDASGLRSSRNAKGRDDDSEITGLRKEDKSANKRSKESSIRNQGQQPRADTDSEKDC